MDWKELIFSDVTRDYVSSITPHIGDTVFIRIRLGKNHPVQKVLLWTLVNGDGHWLEMKPVQQTKHFEYYQGALRINEPYKQYRFVLITRDEIWYYTRSGIYDYPPTEDHDFVLLAQDDIPDWVSRGTFYHIFPDRFARSGHTSLKPYTYNGFQAREMPWEAKPLPYNEAGCLDFYMGDLDGIRQKIPYLKDLGVTALYLNPIFEAPSTHRYDCSDYTRVDEKLGGNTALIRLSEALHEADMKLMLDISINHTGKNHHWFQRAQADPTSEEREYYYFDKQGNYVSWYNIPILPQLNYCSQKLRDKMYRLTDSVLQMYLKPPYFIDGWRFDVGNQTARHDEDQMGHEVFQEIRQALKSVRRDIYLIGEHWEDNISYHLGNEWDGAMNYFASLRPLRFFAGETDHFLKPKLPPTFERKRGNARAIASQIIQHYSRLPNPLMHTQFNLLDSHDIVRFHNQKNLFNKSWYRGMLSIAFLLPGTFSIYYGDEILLDGDTSAIEGCRYPMQWDESRWDKEARSWYQKLAKWKKSTLALQEGSLRFFPVDENVVVMARFTMDEAWIGVLSNAEETREIVIDLTPLGVEENSPLESLWSGERYMLQGHVWRTVLPPWGHDLVKIKLIP
ncbi:alpha amylase N-terminal ig-like domain-containing protein [Thermospira aquatica]|uniref:Alpha amylase N-terminal ig-like domain-containing protein n=1 Tax=Thermospira aquatica TaxID=2828656 RepID=A0AAX3BAG0_9SPIR|nr:alpha amylase N-terminal ig-like domain-containing protein [Thermospira aquatica]URA09254.1 alpha amylase N-terminal ig-like domain-containing protein [Thermospira aquatica]